MSSVNDRQRPPPTVNHAAELLKIFNALAYRHSPWQVFVDFNEMAAISISNTVDLAQREQREARYMEVIKRYNCGGPRFLDTRRAPS